MKKLHFIGIGGSGINGVAFLAREMGYDVTGCDLEKSTAYGKDILQGHNVSHIKNVDLVVASPALFYQDKNNSEIAEARKQNKLITWQEFLGKMLLKNKKVICIAGTHGKSTITAMAGKMLIDAGMDPIVMVGALVPEWNRNSRFGKGEYAVIEADEFNNNFLNYSPEIEVINNVEFDHPDFFKSEKEVLESFERFIENLSSNGKLIVNWDNAGIRKLILTRPGIVKARPLNRRKKFNLKIFGIHNQANAAMVYELGKHLGIGDKKIANSIESFTGIGRRMELIADLNGVKIYDDYAHHPTAIKTTLEGLRAKYPNYKILAIVEPHGFRRTKALLENYKGVFDSVDKAIIGPIYKARDEVDPEVTPEKVAIASGHKDINSFDNFEELIVNCKSLIANYNALVVMGAGKSYLWAREIVRTLNEVEGLKSFKDLTTFRIGGKIKRYIEIKNKEDVPSIISGITESGSEIFILGGGSDILVSDSDFQGTVIKFTGNSITKNGEKVFAAAGAIWDDLVNYTVENSLAGMECLSGIPGTVGASPIQNIGAYGQEIKNTFVSLDAYDIEYGKFITFSKKDCKFSYRNSIFKTKEFWQKYLILSVNFKLTKDGTPEIKYDSLKNYLAENGIIKPNLKQIRDAVLTIRSGKFENPKEVGNAGSFFQNPIVTKQIFEKIKLDYPEIKYFEEDGNYKIFAAWLIETAGWKGKKYKTAGVSAKHALVLINPDGNAKAEDIYDLSEKIIKDVNIKFGIELKREVQLINFN